MISESKSIAATPENDQPKAVEQLWPQVYDELRRLAAQKLAQEKPGQTLQATALVHEAYLRLTANRPMPWENRQHFFAAAAEAMRRILVENARRKASGKRGGKQTRLELDPDALSQPERSEELLTLDDALEQLNAADPTVAALVRLRYFAGMTIPEAASVVGVAPRTADSYWSYAKAWLLDYFRK